MITIWKFALDHPKNVYGRVEIEMPIDAQVLSCQEQDGRLCLWAKVDIETADRTKTRAFYIAGTGKVLDPGERQYTFIDTVQQPPFIWHVFEES